MSDQPVFQGEERYVAVFKGDRFIQRALCNILFIRESLYGVHYSGSLNGHSILDLSIPRKDQPNHHISEG